MAEMNSIQTNAPEQAKFYPLSRNAILFSVLKRNSILHIYPPKLNFMGAPFLQLML